jgi:predicted MFS family arabinose efflux permease
MAEATDSDAKCGPSRAYVWYVILILTVVNAVNYMDRVAISVLAPQIKSDLHVSDGELGLLSGLAFFIFYALFGIPIARWADRGVRTHVIAAGLGLWSIFTALSGAARNFTQLALARIGVGAGEAGCLPAGYAIVADYVPIQKRGGAYAITTFGSLAGRSVGFALGAWLGARLGWRLAFVALGVPGVALALWVLLTLREPRRGVLDGDATVHPQQPLSMVLRSLIRLKTWRRICAAAVVSGFIQYGTTQWWPSFYMRSFDLSQQKVGLYLGDATFVGYAIGMLLGGLVTDKVSPASMRAPLVIAAGAALLSLPATLGSLFVHSINMSFFFVGLTTLCWGLVSAPCVAIGASVVPPAIRATGGAIDTFVTAIVGFGLGPFLVGALSDKLAQWVGGESLRYALLAPVCLIPALIVIVYSASRSVEGDLAALGMSGGGVPSHGSVGKGGDVVTST